MSGKADSDRPKQAYERPTVRTINLVGEEVMAIGCKTPATTGGLGGIVAPCASLACHSSNTS
jgi:hypothetical protein